MEKMERAIKSRRQSEIEAEVEIKQVNEEEEKAPKTMEEKLQEHREKCQGRLEEIENKEKGKEMEQMSSMISLSLANEVGSFKKKEEDKEGEIHRQLMMDMQEEEARKMKEAKKEDVLDDWLEEKVRKTTEEREQECREKRQRRMEEKVEKESDMKQKVEMVEGKCNRKKEEEKGTEERQLMMEIQETNASQDEQVMVVPEYCLEDKLPSQAKTVGLEEKVESEEDNKAKIATLFLNDVEHLRIRLKIQKHALIKIQASGILGDNANDKKRIIKTRWQKEKAIKDDEEQGKADQAPYDCLEERMETATGETRVQAHGEKTQKSVEETEKNKDQEKEEQQKAYRESHQKNKGKKEKEIEMKQKSLNDKKEMTASQTGVQEDRSLRRRLIGWISQKVKNYHYGNIERTLVREQEEGDQIYKPCKLLHFFNVK